MAAIVPASHTLHHSMINSVSTLKPKHTTLPGEYNKEGHPILNC